MFQRVLVCLRVQEDVVYPLAFLGRSQEISAVVVAPCIDALLPGAAYVFGIGMRDSDLVLIQDEDVPLALHALRGLEVLERSPRP